MIDPLIHARRLLDEIDAAISHPPTVDFVREVALTPWGATGTSYTDPGPIDEEGAATPTARWLFDTAGAQTDATGNGWDLPDSAPGQSKVSDLNVTPGGWSAMCWVQAGWLYVPDNDTYFSGVVVGGFRFGGTYYPGGAPVTGPSGWVHWAASYIPWNIGSEWSIFMNGDLMEDAFTPSGAISGSPIGVVGDSGYISDVRVYEGYLDESTLAPIVAAGP